MAYSLEEGSYDIKIKCKHNETYSFQGSIALECNVFLVLYGRIA